jgi:hypothetical protein
MNRRVLEYGFRMAVPFFIVGAALAADPDYPHGDFSGDCTECHDAERWSPAAISKSWTHPDAFPLVGAHRTATCKACHANLDFKTAPKDCADCHQDAHRGELGTDCARCHRPTNFLDRGKQLDDHRATRFPLVGAHATQDCESCHRMQPQGALTWVGLDVACVSCHLADYQATTDPDHEAGQFPTDCLACHRPTAWSRASVDHDRTGFPLTGRHRALACSDCHANGFSGTPSECFACHADDYNGTTDPNHAQAGFPTNCEQCHDTTSFGNATFTHPATFPLTGAHVPLPCASCHAGGYAGTPTDCFACHAGDYNATTDPDHEAAGFSTTCTNCHTTATFANANFTHTATFPLAGAHATTNCNACHAGGYAGTPTDCFACHAADYNGTTDPNHAAAGFPTTCTTCHSGTTTWSGAQMPNHDAAYFPIYSGRHLGRWDRCSDCHTQQTNFAVFSCFQCHGQTETASHHSGVNGYAYDSNLCYQCHPRGEAN